MHARGKTLGISVYAKFEKNVDKFQQKFAKLKKGQLSCVNANEKCN